MCRNTCKLNSVKFFSLLSQKDNLKGIYISVLNSALIMVNDDIGIRKILFLKAMKNLEEQFRKDP